MNFIIILKLNDEPVRYHYGAMCSAGMIAGAEGASKKLSGKRNRFGQHSGEQYDCTEEVIRRAARHRLDNLSGKRTEADERTSHNGEVT